MREVRIDKSKPGVDPVNDTVIRIGPTEVMEFTDRFTYIADYSAYYRHQATLLESALRDSLPGGTYDALLLKMLEYRASLLKVGFPSVQEER